MGFDADHCFVKYNLQELFEMMVRAYLKDLHEKEGYPAIILEFDYEHCLGTALNNVVWDIEHGTILKLAKNKLVV